MNQKNRNMNITDLFQHGCESLPEEYEPAFRLDSALDHRVSNANHPRLQDQFTHPAFNRFNDKITKCVRNEVDWEGLREKWN